MPRRVARIAALAVGEGKAEMAVLQHLKHLYLPRDCGVALKIRGGIGKGGRGVLEHTIRISAGVDYDRRIAVLDTDTDWDAEERARATDEEIIVIESKPCLEAWLLAVHGIRPQLPTADLKRRFSKEFGRPAHDPTVYPQHFPRERLDGARGTVPELDKLLRAFDL